MNKLVLCLCLIFLLTFKVVASSCFSSAFFNKATIRINNNDTIHSRDTLARLNLSMVNIGYGEQKKSVVTGAISSVSSKEIDLLHVASVESALQGHVAGVSVINEGGPGVSPIVRIRGNGSISYAAQPLYVVDDIPTFEISAFNTYDIEAVDILKDASSTAIYGSRGANGVVLITTKKGTKKSKLKVSLDSYVGVQIITKTLNLLNTKQYLQYGTALNTNAGISIPSRFINMDQPIYTGAAQTYDQTNTDWQGALFQKAMMANNNLSLTAGSKYSTVYAAAGYFNQDGIMVNTGYKRYSFQLNSEHQLLKRVKLGQTITYSYGDRNNEKQQYGRTNILQALQSAPYIPIKDPTMLGGYRSASSGTDGTDAENPIMIQNLFESTTGISKFLGSLYLEIKIADCLTFKSTFGYDYLKKNDHFYSPIFNDGFNSNIASTTEDKNREFSSKLFTNQFTFDKTWNNHNIKAVVLYEMKNYNDEINDLLQQSIGGTKTNGWALKNKESSYASRLLYNFKEKYFLNGSLRTDGPTDLSANNEWDYFPSVSLGWRIDKESFLAQSNSISLLKLSAGYGEAGYNSMVNYDNSSTNLNFNNEISSMTNIDLDLGLFQGKLTFSADWFNKVTDNLILAALYDLSIGYGAPAYTNIGKMKNSGWEFQSAVQINAGDLKSTLSGNLSFIKNKVEALYSNSPIDAGFNQDYGAYNMTRTAVGQPIQSFYGWKANGIFQSAADVAKGPIQVPQSINLVTHLPDPSKGTAPGDIRFKDVNGDGIIDGNDRQYLGSYLPIFTYSFNYSGTYKKFDFSVFFQGVYGNKIYNGTKVIQEGMLRLFNAGPAVLNAWTPTNTNTDIPRAIAGDPNQNDRASDRFIESGSYLRIKSLSIGYTLPLSAITKGIIRHVRIYISGQNLLTFTKYTGYDPEVGAYYPLGASNLPGTPGVNGTSTAGLLNNGVDYGMVPQPRTILAGIQLNF